MHIRKGDLVEVISGKDRGRRGKVLVVMPGKQRAIVEGINMVKKHRRANPQKGLQAGIIEQEAPVHVSNLLPIDRQTDKPTRVGFKYLSVSEGVRRKVRVARRSGAEMDR